MMGFGKQDGNGSNQNDMLKQLLESMQMDDEVVKAKMNDQRLLQLAEYAVTHGYTKSTVEPEAFQSTFTEYKSLVKRGSMKLRDLESDVFKRWGVQEDAREQVSPDTSRTIGFSIDDIEVADIPEDSEDNR